MSGIDPDRGAILLKDYTERRIAQRPRLRPRTVQLYTWVLGKHITPYLGSIPLNRIDTPTVREWRAVLLKRGVSESMTAKAHAHLVESVDDLAHRVLVGLYQAGDRRHRVAARSGEHHHRPAQPDRRTGPSSGDPQQLLTFLVR